MFWVEQVGADFPLGLKNQILFLVSHMDSAMKVHESVGRLCESCGETLEIHNPNKHTEFDKLKLEGFLMV